MLRLRRDNVIISVRDQSHSSLRIKAVDSFIYGLLEIQMATLWTNANHKRCINMPLFAIPGNQHIKNKIMISQRPTNLHLENSRNLLNINHYNTNT